MDRLPPALLLDLDDTIVSFSAGKPDFWRQAFEQHAEGLGLDGARFSDAVSAVSGPYWADPQRAHLGRLDLVGARRTVAVAAMTRLGVDALEVCHRVADHFTELKEAAVAPFEGAIETLQALRQRGVRLGLVTNGSSEFQRRKLRRYDLEPYFEAIAVEGELGVGKPDPEPFRHVMDRMGLLARDCWMVGDNLRADVAGAQALGIRAVWNDHARAGLPANPPAQPDRIIHRLSDLVP